MGLERISLGLAILFAAFGVLTGAFMQAELSQQGIQFAGSGESMQVLARAYNVSVYLHGASLSIGLPLALCCAYPAATLAAQRRGRAITFLAVVLTVIGPVIVFSGLFLAMQAPFAARSGHAIIPIVACLCLIGAIVMMARMPRPRGAVIVFLIAGIVMLGLTLIPLGVYWHSETAAQTLRDTSYMTGIHHIVGLAIVCFCLTVLSARAGIRGTHYPMAPAMLFCVALFGAGAMMILPTLQLGLSGMPRGYIDYVKSFAMLHRQVSIWAFVVLAISLLSAGYAILRASKRPPSAAEAFD